MMDDDWWLGSFLSPEEGLTSGITISPSNTQSHHSMASKWQKTLCSRHSRHASRGKLRLFWGKECASVKVFFLFWSDESVMVLLFFLDASVKGFPLTVLTPWYECWKRKLGRYCRHCGRVFTAVMIITGTCVEEYMICVGFLWFEKKVTLWNTQFWSAELVQTSKVNHSPASKGFKTIHYWFITIYFSVFCGLK